MHRVEIKLEDKRFQRCEECHTRQQRKLSCGDR